jgi:hypothetical protein
MSPGRKAGWDQPVGDEPDQHVGAMLHGLREQAGVKQHEIAADLEIDRATSHASSAANSLPPTA